jgi:hypothetical protein
MAANLDAANERGTRHEVIGDANGRHEKGPLFSSPLL